MLSSLFDDVGRIMKIFPGRAREDKRGLGYEYDGLGNSDCTHIFLAKRYDCQLLATFDSDFEESRPEIQPLLMYKDTL